MLTYRRTNQLGDKGLSSGATKLTRYSSPLRSLLPSPNFMHGHGHSKLAKKLNDKIPKTVDEMIERFRAFIRGEVVVGSAEMGIVMMETSREALWECRQPERMQDSRKEVQWHQREEKNVQIRNPSQIRMTERQRKKMGVSTEGGRSILFHPYAERIKELSCYTSEDDGGGLSRSKRTERGNILGRNSNKKQKCEGKEVFGYMVQIRFETTEGSGWTNEAEKALQRIKRKLNKLQTWAVPKEGRETIEKGFGFVRIILVNPKEKMYAYAIRLKFKASNHAIDYEALLTGLAVFVSKGMKDLHVFMDLPKLVAQTEGNNTPATEQERKIGNHKVRISQSGSISGYQNKTIGGRDKQQQEGKSNKQCTKCKAKLQLGR
ncbi:hypothetical protein Tco_0332862 [Tanacetum coccineum]